jgi:hypothetical protein
MGELEEFIFYKLPAHTYMFRMVLSLIIRVEVNVQCLKILVWLSSLLYELAELVLPFPIGGFNSLVWTLAVASVPVPSSSPSPSSLSSSFDARVNVRSLLDILWKLWKLCDPINFVTCLENSSMFPSIIDSGKIYSYSLHEAASRALKPWLICDKKFMIFRTRHMWSLKI